MERLARSHELYTANPDEDGKYHCPKEGEAGCSHAPTSLKCNYYKYVDFHLKPYRRKNESCIGSQFTSPACVLRHEREAHGMHGHGSRPHLCQFPDCERSQPGQGFPRRYNLFDHMKRVHDWSPEPPPGMEPSPSKRIRGKRSHDKKPEPGLAVGDDSPENSTLRSLNHRVTGPEAGPGSAQLSPIALAFAEAASSPKYKRAFSTSATQGVRQGGSLNPEPARYIFANQGPGDFEP